MGDKSGGAAFPVATGYGLKINSSAGMTLRDFFAAIAMHADILNNSALSDESIAKRAYATAEAMIEEMENTNARP